ncbi:MAG: hypothetical protein Q9217_003720 [Psora testacea]
MFSQVSGLGRLLNSASASLSSNPAKTQRQYDSVTEEIITYDLLYPEVESLSQNQHQTFSSKLSDPASVAAAARSADDQGGLNVKASRDVRFIAAQHINDVSHVLYDSHPPTPYSIRTSTPNVAEANGQLKVNRSGVTPVSSNHWRKANTTTHSYQSPLPQALQSSVISKTTSRASANEFGGLFGSARHRGSTTRPVTNEDESSQSKVAREEREEIDDLVNCIFGAPGFPSTSSTKIHVKRYKPQSPGVSRPTSSESHYSESPKAFSPRRSFLSRSTTAQNLPSLSAVSSATTDHQASRLSSTYILITKLFSIGPNAILQSQSITSQNGQQDGRPQPQPEELYGHPHITPGREDNQTKHIKTPTFAVALVIYLPARSGDPDTSSLKQSCSATDRDSQPSQLWSSHVGSKLKWLSRELDQRIEYVLGQWSMLIRTLANLEVIMYRKIMALLVERYTPSITQKRQTLQLGPDGLQSCTVVEEAASKCRKRIVLALQVRPVINGQDRWNIWKGVARSIGNATCGQQHRYFLFNLLTAFLGHQNEWLNHVAPKSYRQQNFKRREDYYGEVDTMRTRTVIVSLDKMVARRIIFLLSTFLPSTTMAFRPEPQHGRPTASAGDIYSGSPPYGALISRGQSRQRRANAYNLTFPDSESTHELCGKSSPLHVRSSSDARSIRSTALPIASNETRKSSTTTTVTVMPQSQQAVPLFTSFSPEIVLGTSAEARPGSSGSMAALRLQRTLSRSESNEHSNSSTDSRSGGRWGSTRSGFWSSRRGSSTENSDVMASSGEGLGISGVSKAVPTGVPVNKLNKMVEDTQSMMAPSAPAVDRVIQSLGETTSKPKTNQAHKVPPPKPVPRHSPLEPFPLTLSVNEEDGVIDVQYSPTAAQSSSFPSTFTSPGQPHTAASSYNTGSTLRSPTPAPMAAKALQSDPAVNVAGWLRSFHPDFALQAVRPYEALHEDIKQSMRTEPAPSIVEGTARPLSTHGWTDVCTTLVADNATFSITRITLRRKNASSPHHQADALLGREPAETAEEQFIEEPIVDHDQCLIEVLERILWHSSHSSGAPSRASSPPRSTSEGVEYAIPTLGFSRNECKRIVFGALARVAKSVAAELDGNDAQEKEGVSGYQRREQVPDNTLRQGVRRWMNEVKAGSS